MFTFTSISGANLLVEIERRSGLAVVCGACSIPIAFVVRRAAAAWQCEIVVVRVCACEVDVCVQGRGSVAESFIK